MTHFWELHFLNALCTGSISELEPKRKLKTVIFVFGDDGPRYGFRESFRMAAIGCKRDTFRKYCVTSFVLPATRDRNESGGTMRSKETQNKRGAGTVRHPAAVVKIVTSAAAVAEWWGEEVERHNSLIDIFLPRHYALHIARTRHVA